VRKPKKGFDFYTHIRGGGTKREGEVKRKKKKKSRSFFGGRGGVPEKKKYSESFEKGRGKASPVPKSIEKGMVVVRSGKGEKETLLERRERGSRPASQWEGGG